MQVLVVQEAEDLEEEQQREERVQVLHTCQVNMTEIRENDRYDPGPGRRVQGGRARGRMTERGQSV